MSNIVQLVVTGRQANTAVQVADDLYAGTKRISAAAEGLAHLDIDPESRAEALTALYEAARLVQRAGAITERALLIAAERN